MTLDTVGLVRMIRSTVGKVTWSMVVLTLPPHMAPVSRCPPSPSLAETGVTGAGDRTLWPPEEGHDLNMVTGGSKIGTGTVGPMLLLLVSMVEFSLQWSQSLGTITSFLFLHIAKMIHHHCCSRSAQEFSFRDIRPAEAQAGTG